MAKKFSSPADSLPVPIEFVERRIYLIRGQKVMLDSDLAELYQVTTGNLNLAVRRNINRFPPDFMFQLTEEETNSLLLQIARAKTTGRGGRRTRPYAFTELGVAMQSSVLNSERAVQMNIIIMRAFVRLREAVAGNRELAHRLEQVEAKLRQHGGAIGLLAGEIRKLKQPPPQPPRRRIGFHAPDEP